MRLPLLFYFGFVVAQEDQKPGDEQRSSLELEKRSGIESGNSNQIQWNNLPLRVPPDLADHFRMWSAAAERHKRQNDKPVIHPGVYSCGHQGTEMFINFINPRYPGHDSSTGTCHFRLSTISPKICQIRVDFVDTEMLTPTNGTCDDQNLIIKGSIWPTGFRKLCGINPDQHFYIQMDKQEPEQYVDFTVTTIKPNRPYKFGLWITQINCAVASAVQAPPGCLQYHFGSEGIIKSFNFEGVQYIGSQNYKICIRTERGACFLALAADANHFMLQLHPSDTNHKFNRFNRNNPGRPPSGRGDDDCTTDFLMIPGGRENLTTYGATFDRFCGGYLNTESAKEDSITIYTEITSPVIWLQFVTGPRESIILAELKRQNNGNSYYRNGNNLNDKFEGTGPGFRIRFSQLSSTSCTKLSVFNN